MEGHARSVKVCEALRPRHSVALQMFSEESLRLSPFDLRWEVGKKSPAGFRGTGVPQTCVLCFRIDKFSLKIFSSRSTSPLRHNYSDIKLFLRDITSKDHLYHSRCASTKPPR